MKSTEVAFSFFSNRDNSFHFLLRKKVWLHINDGKGLFITAKRFIPYNHKTFSLRILIPTMDILTSQNSHPFSSIISPSTTRLDSEIDNEEVDAGDEIVFDENLLERNIGINEHADDQSLRRQQFLQTPVQHSGPRAYLLRCSIGLILFSCIIYVIYDFCGDRKIETILIASLDWTHAHPYKGIIAVIFCYIVATVFFVPGSILTFGAGFAIGSAVDNLYLGILLAVAVSTICV